MVFRNAPLLRSLLAVRHMSRHALLCVFIVYACAVTSRTLWAQVVPGSGSAIGSQAADRARLNQVTGNAPLFDSDEPPTTDLRVIAPTVELFWNSRLPSAGNDGALWAGRGASVSATAGVTATWAYGGARADVAVLPEATYSENVPFQILPGRSAGRSAFSSPWHLGANSADLPLRFGDQGIRTIGLGQSAVSLTLGGATVGASAANEWWGPALRNTLVLSNNAAGIPRLFVRTARPLRTGLGWIDARLIAGGLTESPYFDRDPSNDARSASGVLVTFRPAEDSGLTLGLSRLVIAPVPSNGAVLGHAFDVLTHWNQVRDPSDTVAGGKTSQRTDQIFSLFARWVFPRSGVEAYGEWARTELPRSLREYLEAPQSTQGYTIGLQWARPVQVGQRVRLQAEFTYLEQTVIWPDRPPMDYYTGRAAIQGFTQRGQVLGAATGPGSSSQFLAGDWVTKAAQVGLFAGRVRAENDALYRQVNPAPTQHDVTVFAGLRGGTRIPRFDLSMELVASKRLNYLFQSQFSIQAPVIATDITNLSLRVALHPM